VVTREQLDRPGHDFHAVEEEADSNENQRNDFINSGSGSHTRLLASGCSGLPQFRVSVAADKAASMQMSLAARGETGL
jgi:hypothetical protein